MKQPIFSTRSAHARADLAKLLHAPPTTAGRLRQQELIIEILTTNPAATTSVRSLARAMNLNVAAVGRFRRHLAELHRAGRVRRTARKTDTGGRFYVYRTTQKEPAPCN